MYLDDHFIAQESARAESRFAGLSLSLSNRYSFISVSPEKQDRFSALVFLAPGRPLNAIFPTTRRILLTK